jgi:LmbE family N-acetylglucosaminyl deacetylase
MRLDFRDDRLLAVVAHPDDAELLCVGTLARARKDGAEIGVCVLCRGDKGQPAERIANLAAVRRREMQAAAKRLGAKLFRGTFADGTLSDTAAGRRRLVDVFRAFRPTLVLAHFPGDYHPDHRAASQLAEAATWFASSHGQVTKQPPLETPPALWWMDCIQGHGFEPSLYVDISDFVELKHELLACHASQLSRSADSDFASLADLMRRQFENRGAEAGVAAAEAFRPHLVFKRARAW